MSNGRAIVHLNAYTNRIALFINPALYIDSAKIHFGFYKIQPSLFINPECNIYSINIHFDWILYNSSKTPKIYYHKHILDSFGDAFSNNNVYLNKFNVPVYENYSTGTNWSFNTTVGNEYNLPKTEESWRFSTDIRNSYDVHAGKDGTLWFYRLNSNIYKNIFDHILFDLEFIKDKILPFPYRQTQTIIQYFIPLEENDLVYIDKNGFYQKALATEEKYNVVGIISKKINNNTYELTTSGILKNINTDFKSDSGILYLSDTEPGKYTSYENITSNFYTPIGFYNINNIILSIEDSSVGDKLQLYQDNIFANFNYTNLSNQDIIDIETEVLNNAW